VATVRYSTIVDNEGSASASAFSVLASSAQELEIGGIQNRGALELDSSIVALQRSGPDCWWESLFQCRVFCPPPESYPITSLGTNLDSDDTCNLDPGLGDLPDTDPQLGPLQDNGGTTETHAPSSTSPALDRINAGSKTCGTEVGADQRGIVRPQGAGCDIGAYETEQFPLTVSTTGSGSGSVTGRGISCDSDCTESYPEDTVVVLTASADAGSTFSGWNGACTNTTGDCFVAMTEPETVTATFTVNTHQLAVSLAGDGSGKVSSVPAGVDCPAGDCQASFDDGTAVTLTVVADNGSIFSGWSGVCSAAGECTVTMTETESVTATFTLVSVDTQTRVYLPFIMRQFP
jgi:hypothetical protein